MNCSVVALIYITKPGIREMLLRHCSIARFVRNGRSAIVEIFGDEVFHDVNGNLKAGVVDSEGAPEITQSPGG